VEILESRVSGVWKVCSVWNVKCVECRVCGVCRGVQFCIWDNFIKNAKHI